MRFFLKWILFFLIPFVAFADEAQYKVALLLTGPVTDGGWNASAYEGLLQIKEKLGAKISQSETRTPLEFEEGYKEYAKLGYDLVIGHGFEFQDAAKRLGPRYPNTVFLVSSGNVSQGNNVSSMSFKLEEGAYLLGVLAGHLSKTGVVGTIGGMPLPPVQKGFAGFVQGFQSVRPDGRVLEAYLGSWEDVGGAKEAALAQIREGADLILHNADAAGWGVVVAAREKKILVLGTNRDQTQLAPDVMVGSAVCDIPQILLESAEQIKNKNFTPRKEAYGLKEHGVWVALNPAFKEKLSKEVLEQLEREKQKIISGELFF